ncbi:hypothetical protein CWO07_09155 [Vibrio splendidus]|uniref:Uncharacterized protein n=1 Tax=Vibrio splendidus TaxID=29497 RepID=A0A2T5EWZ1_VIBSP|nr:hypothetical protein [Vibrio splendidus]PTP36307.1 hypothetical protein CWO07_09155 [Vibrio splendidus]
MNEERIQKIIDDSAEDLLIKMSDQLFEQAHQLITLKLAPERIRNQVLFVDDRCQSVLSSFLYHRKFKYINIENTSLFTQSRELQEKLIIEVESHFII